MSSKTKIIIMKKREVIYTAIFAALGITLILLMILMFRPKSTPDTLSTSKSLYTPGVYTAPITLNNNAMDLKVRVDKDHINSISLTNLSETASAMFPLMQPALESLAVQICETQSTKNIYYEASRQYTSQMLLDAIDSALKLARTS
ncbi:MAG: hypothetical protein Q4C50_07275 [Eubacteriales bacterium]|nr:hypothetical protein [Eubacteriales bacterium]